MHLGSRSDEDQGRTRTVVWSEGSETDLGVLIAALVSSIVFAGSIACLVEFHGVAHVVWLVVGVVSGLYAAVLIVPLLLIIGGIFVVKDLLAQRSSMAQRVSWVVVALGLGALLGVDTYSIGVPGLLTGPLVMALAAIVLAARPNLSPRARKRAVALSAIVGVAAVAVGLTIFL